MRVPIFCSGMRFGVVSLLLLALSSACSVDGGDEGNTPLSITSDATWRKGDKIEISGQLEVNGATLTIEAGARVRLAPAGQIVVGRSFPATLRIQGTDDEPVIFEAMDPSKPWLGIHLLKVQPETRISECEIRHAGTTELAALRIAQLNFPIDDLEIHEAVGVGMQIETTDLAAGAVLRDLEVHTRGGHAIVAPGDWFSALRGDLDVQTPDGFGIFVLGGGVRAETLFMPRLSVPYVVDGPVQIDVRNLHLGQGNVFQFTSRGEFDLGCNAPTLVKAERCVFTSTQRDKQRGQWKGITCNSYVLPQSIFDGCAFQAAGAGEPAGALVLYDCKDLIVRNCRFTGNRGHAIILVDKAALSPASQGNTFLDNERGDISRVRGARERARLFL